MAGPRHTPRTGLRWFAVVTWMTVIFSLSSISGSSLPSGPASLAHFVEYSVLGALLAWALLPVYPPRAAVPLAVLLGSAYGVTDELHQLLTPGRSADVADWGVDTMGAVFGALTVAFAISRYRKRRSQVPTQPDSGAGT